MKALRILLVCCLFVSGLSGMAATLSGAMVNGTASSAYLFLIRTSDGAMIEGPNFPTSAGGTVTFFKNYADTFVCYGITPAQMLAAGLDNNTATAAQKISAGATLASPSSHTYANTANDSVTFTWTGGTPPPSYTNYVHDWCVTNTLPTREAWELYETNRVGVVQVREFVAEPGQRFCYSETNGVAGVGIFRHNYTPGQEGLEVLHNGPPSTTSGDVESNDYSTANPVNGNIWNSQSSTNRLGAPPLISETTQSRDDTTASTGDTLQRQREANDEKRHAELKSLFVATDRAQGIRDTVALDSLNLGLNRLNAQVAASGLNVSNAVAGLRSSLEAGTNNASLALGTNVTAGAVQAGVGAAQTVLGGLIPAVTIPDGDAPVLTLPFSVIHDDLDDVDFDFGSDELEPYVLTFRALELVGLTVWFLVLGLKLLGRTSNV